MTQDEIIELGVKAELCDEFGTINFEYGYRNEIIAFAKLVYERGVIDGRQIQRQTSVDKAVNAMSRTWVDLTTEEIEEVERWVEFKEEGSGRIPMGKLVAYISNKLRSKNT
jgi:hypothetical protein